MSLGGVTATLSENCRQLIELQRGVLARWQVSAVGPDRTTLKSRLQSGRWHPVYRGVYATFTGDPPRESALWAAVLRAGPGAVLSHETAAELDGLARERSAVIHVTVPAVKRVNPVPGLRVHRSLRPDEARHPARMPPRTRIEETVLDLAQAARTFDVAFGWLCQACGSRRTTPDRLLAAMYLRAKLRWRDIQRDNTPAADGILTLRYGWADVTRWPCRTAEQIATALRLRGWTGVPTPCGPNCPLGGA